MSHNESMLFSFPSSNISDAVEFSRSACLWRFVFFFFFLISVFSWSLDGSKVLYLSPICHPINFLLIDLFIFGGGRDSEYVSQRVEQRERSRLSTDCRA